MCPVMFIDCSNAHLIDGVRVTTDFGTQNFVLKR